MGETAPDAFRFTSLDHTTHSAWHTQTIYLALCGVMEKAPLRLVSWPVEAFTPSHWMPQMLALRVSPATRQQFLSRQRSLAFSYSQVGATASLPPAGYEVDRTRALLGHGGSAFLAAQAALRQWRHFDLHWVEAWPADTPLLPGEVVSIAVHVFGTTWLNAARIVYVVDEAGPLRRFGYAYGTLPGHAERGEERFLVEWNRETGEVWYDILAFSRPRHPLSWLGYPLVRWLQKCFARDSVASMQNAVTAGALP
jgi:uncharacterized protein (UPF0548 family)